MWFRAGVCILAIGVVGGAQRGEAVNRLKAVPRTDFEIFSIGVDGRAKHNLTHETADDQAPALSPDGS